MDKMNKEEEKFLEFLNELPSVDTEKELLGIMTMVMGEMSNRLLISNVGVNIPITATAAYLAVVAETYTKGCKDVEMASLSAKTQMIDKFKKGFKSD